MGYKLSKTTVMKGLQCEKALWLQTKKRHLAPPPDEKTKALFEEGKEIGKLAQSLYPNGVEIPFNTQPYSRKFDLTDHYIQSGKQTIYEATFQTQTMMCMVDILHRTEDGWHLIEVKSSRSQKEEHLYDIAIQFAILTSCGLPIKKAILIHINPDYIRSSSFEIPEFFTQIDVTESIQPYLHEIRQKEPYFVKLSQQYHEPKQAIGPQCMSPYPCAFKEYCWQHIPERSVFDLIGLSYDERFELYYKGYVSFNELSHAPLNTPTKRLVEAENNASIIIDKKELKSFLSTLFYPMTFFDFETIFPTIPIYPKSYSRQQIPFQYSAHIMNSPFDVPLHKEFLANPTEDPRESLIKAMIRDIPENTCVIVYNETFEKSVISELIDAFPQYKKELESRFSEFRDLMIPFQKRFVYSHELLGRYSIKKVLPTFVPELSYDSLDIQEGLTASETYRKIPEMDEITQEKTKQALLEYCKLDTYAMIALLNKLHTY